MASFKVEFAEDGSQALARMREAAPDLIVTDLQMPNRNGLELVAAVRMHHPGVPIILMTGHGSEDLAVEVLHRGAANYVPKPQLGERLLDSVEEALSLVRADRTYDRLIACLKTMRFRFRAGKRSGPDRSARRIGAADGRRHGLTDATGRFRVGAALKEALLNAIYRGNLEISFKQMQDTRVSLLGRQGRRRAGQAASTRRPTKTAKSACAIAMDDEQARFVISDEGPGFDPASIPAAGQPGSLDPETGRGLVLMRAFFDEVTFNDGGNEVTLVKRRAKRSVSRHRVESRKAFPCQPCSSSMTRPWTASWWAACWPRADCRSSLPPAAKRPWSGCPRFAAGVDRHRSCHARHVGPGPGGPGRLRHPKIPVILMTGKGSEEIAVKALKAGAASYVPKGVFAPASFDHCSGRARYGSMSGSRTARLMGCLKRGQFQFVLGNDAGLIPSLINHVQSLVSSVGLCDEASVIRVCIALEEALRNAMFHGNLELTSEQREGDPDEYQQLIDERTAADALCQPAAASHGRGHAHQRPLRHSRSRSRLRSLQAARSDRSRESGKGQRPRAAFDADLHGRGDVQRHGQSK